MAVLQPHPVEIHPPDIAGWRDGNAGHYAHAFSAPEPGAEVLITSLVHGNEYAGAIAMHELLYALNHQHLRLRKGRLTALFANIAAFGRFDAAQPDASRYVDQDFNRVWSESVLHSSHQSCELARAREILPLVTRATHLLDLHSMHEPCEPLLITGSLKRNIAFAQSLGGAGQIVIDAGHKDGVRMRDHADFGREGTHKIALLLEAGQHWQRSAVASSQDTMLRFLLRTGLLAMEDIVSAGLQTWLSSDQTHSLPVQVTQAVVAQSMHFAFTHPYSGNEVIGQAGTVIAYDNGRPIITPYDHCVLVMPSVRQLRPGVTTVRLGRHVTTDIPSAT
jgi:predicted deacylase